MAGDLRADCHGGGGQCHCRHLPASRGIYLSYTHAPELSSDWPADWRSTHDQWSTHRSGYRYQQWIHSHVWSLGNSLQVLYRGWLGHEHSAPIVCHIVKRSIIIINFTALCREVHWVIYLDEYSMKYCICQLLKTYHYLNYQHKHCNLQRCIEHTPTPFWTSVIIAL